MDSLLIINCIWEAEKRSSSSTCQGRLSAALTCSAWCRVFWSVAVWSQLEVYCNTMCHWQWCVVKRDYEVSFALLSPSS